MPICKQCSTYFPHSIVIDGKRKKGRNRVYCYTCSPFGTFNYTKIATPGTTDSRKKRLKLKAKEYKGSSCFFCNYNLFEGALVFHHLDPNLKNFQISGTTRSWEEIQKELDKCVLLCCRCHAEVHAGILELPEHLYIGSIIGNALNC